MKILKPGKVEQRKFVCPECRCIFIADKSETVRVGNFSSVDCPCCGLYGRIWWEGGKPFKERDIRDDREAIYGILLSSNPMASAEDLADLLIEKGVTFKEY